MRHTAALLKSLQRVQTHEMQYLTGIVLRMFCLLDQILQIEVKPCFLLLNRMEGNSDSFPIAVVGWISAGMYLSHP